MVQGPFLLFGIVMGIVFAVSLYPATLWIVQLALGRGTRIALLAAMAIALAQGILGGLAAAAVFFIADLLREAPTLPRLLAAGLLLYMGIALALAPKAESIRYTGPLTAGREIATRSFILALFMPVRLPAYAAFTIAMSLHLHNHGVTKALLLGTGISIGAFLWLAYFAGLSALFGQRVPEPICKRSLNKLKKLAVLVCLILSIIALFPLLFTN